MNGSTHRTRNAAVSALVAGILAVLVSVPGAAWAPLQPAACSPAAHAPPATPLQHLFFIIKENHAFENYFGTFPGVLGNPPNASLPATYGSSVYVRSHPIPTSNTSDLPHDRASALADLDGGRMDGFVAQAAAAHYGNASDAVGYYPAATLGPYWAYAQQYALADRFFSGVLGPTLPNRLFDIAGDAGNWTSDELPPAATLDFPTIFDQLSASGISWAYDYSGVRTSTVPLLFPSLSQNPCAERAVVPVAELAGQLQSPLAPSVVFIDPSHSRVFSEHPPANVTLGADWTARVIDTIAQSPVASSSAIFLYYDEYGGFWDPVVPPVTSALGDGFRIPLTILSPYTPPGTIVPTTMDPASLLHFIDENWGLPPLDAAVGAAALPTGAFDFSMTARPLPVVATNVTLTGAEAGGVPAGSLAAASPAPGTGAGAARWAVLRAEGPRGRPRRHLPAAARRAEPAASTLQPARALSAPWGPRRPAAATLSEC